MELASTTGDHVAHQQQGDGFAIAQHRADVVIEHQPDVPALLVGHREIVLPGEAGQIDDVLQRVARFDDRHRFQRHLFHGDAAEQHEIAGGSHAHAALP